MAKGYRPDKFLSNQTVLFDKELGTRLSFIMRARGETQAQFAELLGVSQPQLSAVFNGKATLLRRKNALTFITSKELRDKLGHKAWRYLNCGECAEDFAPYRYTTIDKNGRILHSAQPFDDGESKE